MVAVSVCGVVPIVAAVVPFFCSHGTHDMYRHYWGTPTTPTILGRYIHVRVNLSILSIPTDYSLRAKRAADYPFRTVLCTPIRGKTYMELEPRDQGQPRARYVHTARCMILTHPAGATPHAFPKLRTWHLRTKKATAYINYYLVYL